MPGRPQPRVARTRAACPGRGATRGDCKRVPVPWPFADQAACRRLFQRGASNLVRPSNLRDSYALEPCGRRSSGGRLAGSFEARIFSERSTGRWDKPCQPHWPILTDFAPWEHHFFARQRLKHRKSASRKPLAKRPKANRMADYLVWHARQLMPPSPVRPHPIFRGCSSVGRATDF